MCECADDDKINCLFFACCWSCCHSHSAATIPSLMSFRSHVAKDVMYKVHAIRVRQNPHWRHASAIRIMWNDFLRMFSPQLICCTKKKTETTRNNTCILLGIIQPSVWIWCYNIRFSVFLLLFHCCCRRLPPPPNLIRIPQFMVSHNLVVEDGDDDKIAALLPHRRQRRRQHRRRRVVNAHATHFGLPPSRNATISLVYFP